VVVANPLISVIRKSLGLRLGPIARQRRRSMIVSSGGRPNVYHFPHRSHGLSERASSSDCLKKSH
jgi:hypothetical protein